ncbi:transglutaminase-like domain-containing protein [Chitinophaga sp. Hz27]|uniref:transglutaminase-like domain-containing protein n=1 Tax=Chitinophaga sp. Hz27 TaxID=3347169 RepID=UPI0035DCD68B
MEAVTKRQINSGQEYDFLFPAAMNRDKTIQVNATLDDTIAFIHKVVLKTLPQTQKIAKELSAPTVYTTCRNIWNFVYKNVAYKRDDDGLEQIRSPRRTWHDRKTGVDCDCYSTFISSILTNLNIPHKLRITKYRRDHFQHIYPIVPDNGKMIIIDCVTDHFDNEVPYSEKKDISMNLQYLDGIHGAGLGDRGNDIVFEGGDDDMGELGAKPKKKKRGFFRKVLNKINKINPATVLLRNGFLAAMKLNLFKVASRIKYAYLSPEEATKRGIIKDKYDKLVKVREKLENIFEGAGGNPKNLKKAILKGKGNKNKEVALSGFGFLDSDLSVMYMDSNTPLSALLGTDIYYDENVRGMDGFEGFGELGEPVTGAAIAAASAAVAAIAKIIKGIGNIFGGGQKGSEDFSEGETSAADKEITQTPGSTSSPALLPGNSIEPESSASFAVSTYSSRASDNTTELTPASEATTSNTMIPSTSEAAVMERTNGVVNDDTTNTPQEGFWQKNKKWLLPTVIGVGSLAAIAIGMKLMKTSNHPPTRNGLQGVPKKRHHHKKRKNNIELM